MRNPRSASPLALMVATVLAIAPVLAGHSPAWTATANQLTGSVPEPDPVQPKCNLNARPPICCPPICGDDVFTDKKTDSTQSPPQERRKRDSNR